MDENAAYFSSDELDGDRDCLIRQDLISGKRSPIACDTTQSLAWTIDSADGSRPVAAVFEASKPEIRVLEPQSADGQVLAGLMNALPGESLDRFSSSLDGGKLLFRAYSDRNPGAYYVLDRERKKLKRILVNRAGSTRYRWLNGGH